MIRRRVILLAIALIAACMLGHGPTSSAQQPAQSLNAAGSLQVAPRTSPVEQPTQKWLDIRNPYVGTLVQHTSPEYRCDSSPAWQGSPRTAWLPKQPWGYAANAARPQPFNSLPPAFAHGEYVERERLPHTPSYRLRVDDELELVYRITRNEISRPYEFQVGDRLRIESMLDPLLNRDILQVQPDGTITLRLLGQVRATRRTVQQLRDELETQYARFYVNDGPAITVTPLEVNTKLSDLRDTVVARFGNGGQVRQAKVTPEGTIQLPVIGSIPVQGLTIDELAHEISERYARQIEGIEVMPVLLQRAPRFVYVVGEVRQPGRYTLEAPTSVMQAISLAGGWNVGANLTQVVVFRRDDEWRLMACMINVWHPLYGNTTQAPDDIWLGDSDIVVVPKMKILVLDEFIDLIFTRGIYGVVPFSGVSLNMAKLSSL